MFTTIRMYTLYVSLQPVKITVEYEYHVSYK